MEICVMSLVLSFVHCFRLWMYVNGSLPKTELQFGKGCLTDFSPNNWPSNRHELSSCKLDIDNDVLLVIFGGAGMHCESHGMGTDPHLLNDIWAFSDVQHEWKLLKRESYDSFFSGQSSNEFWDTEVGVYDENNFPFGRYYGGLIPFLNDYIIAIGGIVIANSRFTLNSVDEFKVSNSSWRTIIPYNESASGETKWFDHSKFPPLGAFSYVVLGSKTFIFGGSDVLASTWKYKNAVWMYDAMDNAFEYLGGTLLSNDIGYYQVGRLGEFDPLYRPNARDGSKMWYMSSTGLLYIFGGGRGYNENDMWAFNITLRQFSCLRFSNREITSYVTQKYQFHPSNYPSGRVWPGIWSGHSDLLCVFSGRTTDSEMFNYRDVFCYSIWRNQWKLTNGTANEVQGVYGSNLTNPSAMEMAPGREQAQVWQLSTEKVYVGFGVIRDPAGAVRLNDLWAYRNVDFSCNGKGWSLPDGECNCNDHYFGVYCESWKCGSFFNNETEKVCSDGNGVCVSHDECSCIAEYDGNLCDLPKCYGYNSESEFVCSKKGECSTPGNCVCENNFYGEKCGEKIEDVGTYDPKTKRIEINYNVDLSTLPSFLPVEDISLFPCQILIQFPEILKEANCEFIRKEIVFFSYTERLVIFTDNTTQPFHFVDGMIVEILPTTNSLIGDDGERSNETTACVLISEIKEEEQDGGREIVVGNSFLWALITFPSLLFVFCLFSGIFCIMLLFCCCCVCCSCLVCIIGSSTVCSGVVFYQRKRLSKLDQIEDIEMVIKEQMHEKDSSQAHIKIQKSLFEINMDDITILNIIGEGGSNSIVFKSVWKGEHCAFKCFKTRSLMSNQERFDEFEKEVAILGSVSHPNIIRFFGASLKPPRVGILMEFCENGELLVFVVKFRRKYSTEYPFNEKIRMLKEVCSSLEYLHSRNIIHRDLKCENVLVSRDSSAKLMDFGLSRIVERMSVSKTSRVGTNVYMAPEILSDNYTETIDIFSFAIMMYILLTEESSPYRGIINDTFQLELRIANDPNLRPDLNRLKKCVDPSQYGWVKKVVVKCWNHEPSNRLSALEIREILEKNDVDKSVWDEDEKKEVGENEIVGRYINNENESLEMLREKCERQEKEIQDLKERLKEFFEAGED